MICERWDVVAVPFPSVDKMGTKKRPALIISGKSFNERGHSVLAMITTKSHHPWPGDAEITDLGAAGLNVPCIVRLKLFTLDNRLLLKSLGRLTDLERDAVTDAIHTYIL